MIRDPVLCSREQVIQSFDFFAPYRTQQVDRAIRNAADAVHRLCNRLFYPQDGTRYFDWPNYQSTYPWKIYLDANELAAPATSIVTGTNQPVPTVIPIGNVNFEPINYGPPFSWIELRRDLSSTYGANSTPQRDTSITGTFGYWTVTDPAGTTAATLSPASATSLQVSDGSIFTGVCVGDILLIGTERMIVGEKTPLATSDTVTGAGCTTDSKLDNLLAVTSGASYNAGEQLLVDQEIMYVLYIFGNVLTVIRGWGGSLLQAHNDGATIYAFRQCTVARGQLGTSAAASISSGTSIAKYRIPGGVNELAVAEAEFALQMEGAGWMRKGATIDTMFQQEVGGFGTRTISGHDAALDGLNDLRYMVRHEYGRVARQRTS